MTKTEESNKEPKSTKVNVTVKIEKDLLRKIRIIAAEEGTSISAIVADAIERKSTENGHYEEAKRRAIALMNSGIELNWEKPLSRDEMHERR
jgi:metal-responsive CopG/Arc/MetJ family transcriptional regulator